MKRDAYHDYITGEQVREAGVDGFPALRREVVAALWERSGCRQVTNARMTSYMPFHIDAQIFEITFDSSAWTGGNKP